jgi:hypothetical protein
MGLIACPSCGHQGKVPDQLLGKKIKCQICGTSFQAAPPIAPASPQIEASRGQTIDVDGLEASSWVATPASAAEHDPVPVETNAAFTASPSGPQDTKGPAREYKVLTQKDKFFEGKFELSRLEGALNHYATQGWVVRAMSTPLVTGFSGGPREEIVVLLER